MDKARVQSLTQARDWEVVRAGGVRKRGMGIRGRAEGKGKGENDDLISIFLLFCVPPPKGARVLVG